MKTSKDSNEPERYSYSNLNPNIATGEINLDKYGVWTDRYYLSEA